MKSFNSYISEDSTERPIVESTFWRLPKKTVGNELFKAQSILSRFYSTVERGDDYNPVIMENLIKTLQGIHKSAKKFNSEADLTDEYK